MERHRKSLRSDCRDIGEHLPAVIQWHRAQSEERREELNYPRVVWREFQRAKLRPAAEKHQTKAEEEIHDIEEQAARAVAVKDAEIADLRATISDVEKLARVIFTRYHL